MIKVDTQSLDTMVSHLSRARSAGQTVFTCGNGGSASSASHLAQDLSKGTIFRASPPPPRMRVLCLCDSVPNVTAWANDEGYEHIFSEQLRGLGRQGDLLIAISGSGNSENVLNAVRVAQEIGMRTWGVTGFDGGQLRDLAHNSLHVSCDDMGMVEAVHGVLFHYLIGKLLEEHPERGGIFLDRDGTINARAAPHQHVITPDEFHFLPGALDALAFLAQNSERRIVIVTNQSCIGRWAATWPQVNNLHAWMIEQIVAAGGRIDRIYVCPHTPEDGCECRKPKPLLFHEAAREIGVNLTRSVMIGDSASDVEAGWSAGIPECYQVRRKGQSFPAVEWPYTIVDDLSAAAQVIVKGESNV